MVDSTEGRARYACWDICIPPGTPPIPAWCTSMWLIRALWVMKALWQTRHCNDFFCAAWAGLTADMLMPGGRTTPA